MLDKYVVVVVGKIYWRVSCTRYTYYIVVERPTSVENFRKGGGGGGFDFVG